MTGDKTPRWEPDTSRRRFWGVDGEGYRNPRTGRDEYVYMAAASDDGHFKELGDGTARLTTQECLDFLWSIGRPVDFVCFFGAGYDWSNVLADVPPELIDRIYPPRHQVPDDEADRFEPVPILEGYGVSWLNNAVTLSRPTSKRHRDGTVKLAERFYADVHRFCGGGSFVANLRRWNIGEPAQWERIAGMKAERGDFTGIGRREMDYCREEVELLAQLARRIVTTAEGIDIKPWRWYSGGSAARHLAHAHGVPDHHGGDRYSGAPEPARDAMRVAFGGGRFELAAHGLVPEMWEYDLASAYPAVMRDLPCMNPEHGGRWVNYDVGPWTVYKVRWWPTDPEAEAPHWTPFAFRHDSAAITYPMAGTTWVWAEEMEAGRRMPGFTVRLLDAWSWVPGCACRPWDWLGDVYQQRLDLGKGAAGLAIKVAINSCYGKTADTVSTKSRLTSLLWAGWITSATRAKVLDVLAEHGDKVLMVATDAVFATEPIMGTETPTPSVEGLGRWEYEAPPAGAPHGFTDILMVMPGIYLSPDLLRTRGHSAGEIERLAPTLRQAFLHDGLAAEASYSRSRFVSPRAALHRVDNLRNQWEDTTVTVSFRPSHRLANPRRWPWKPGDRWTRTQPAPGNQYFESAQYSRLASEQYNALLLAERALVEDQP